MLHFIDYTEAFEESKDDYYKRKRNADKVFADLLNKDRYSSKTRLRDLIRYDE